MLLRTSSAPVLSALNSSFFQAEVFKDSTAETPHNVQSLNLSSFHSLASPSPHQSCSSHGIYPAEDAHTGHGGEQELGRVARPSHLNRAQSEGDLAQFSVSIAATSGYPDQGMLGFESGIPSERSKRDLRVSLLNAISPYDVNESISEEEMDEPEQLSPWPTCDSSFPHLDGQDAQGLPRSFVLNDGEVYSSLTLSASGSPVACNGKGCRPLTEPECKQLGFLDMASGVGSGSFEWSGSDDGRIAVLSNSREAYYQGLLQSDPENPLLLQNYAQHLVKEGEVKKAEEYFERAILADPNDGEVLSKYAKLQWDVNRDQDRAETYYGQAVQASPDDCYVMASYASFLWDVEDDEETSPAGHPLPTYGALLPPSSPLLASA